MRSLLAGLFLTLPFTVHATTLPVTWSPGTSYAAAISANITPSAGDTVHSHVVFTCHNGTGSSQTLNTYVELANLTGGIQILGPQSGGPLTIPSGDYAWEAVDADVLVQSTGTNGTMLSTSRTAYNVSTSSINAATGLVVDIETDQVLSTDGVTVGNELLGLVTKSSTTLLSCEVIEFDVSKQASQALN